jgi:hypothetical protein
MSKPCPARACEREQTLDAYSHLWPDSEDMTRAAVDGVLGRVINQPTANAYHARR